MKHEAELLPAEVVPTQIITDVVFTPARILNQMIDENAKAREQFAIAQAEQAEKIRKMQLQARRTASQQQSDCSPSRSGFYY